MKRLFKSLFLRVLVTVSILGYLVTRVDLNEVFLAAKQISPTVWISLILVLVIDRLVAASRWITLIWATGTPLTFSYGLRLFMTSSFLGSFFPGGVGGDITRTWLLANSTDRTEESVVVAVVDRWLGLASILTLGVIGLWNWPGMVDERIRLAMYGLFVIVTITGTVGLFADLVVPQLFPKTWNKNLFWIRLSSVAVVIRRFRYRWTSLILTIGYAFILQFIRILLAWIIGNGLGIDIAFSYYFVVMPVAIVIILLPISISGLGPAQGIMIWMLQPLDVADSMSFTMSTIFILLGFVANLPGAVLYLKNRHRQPT